MTIGVGTALRSTADRMREGNLRGSLINRYRRARGRPRYLLPHAARLKRRTSCRRLNQLSMRLGPDVAYLEIGVHFGLTLECVHAAHRTGVDPAPGFDPHRLPADVSFRRETSDEFFGRLGPARQFDLVFIDGLHNFEQVYCDVIHSLAHLSPRGLILIDDTVPSDAISSMRDQVESLRRRADAGLRDLTWHGDVFRAIRALHDHHPELDYRTIVGSGNPQTLLWRSNSAVTRALDQPTLSAYGALTFEEVFDAGVPTLFNPTDEASAIEAAFQGLGWGAP